MKPGNITYHKSDDQTLVIWDIVDGDMIVFPGLVTPLDSFEADAKAVIDSYIKDTIPAEEAA